MLSLWEHVVAGREKKFANIQDAGPCTRHDLRKQSTAFWSLYRQQRQPGKVKLTC